MKHPFSETIENLQWLEEQSFPLEIWEKHFIPLVDKLNTTISIFRLMRELANEKEN